MVDALATPVAVLALIGIQVESYLRHVTGRPVFWRARAYPGLLPPERDESWRVPSLVSCFYSPTHTNGPGCGGVHRSAGIDPAGSGGRTLQFAALRGRVAIIVYGGRAGVEEHSAWGKRLDAEFRQRGVYRAEDAEADRPVRILAVAEMGASPRPFEASSGLPSGRAWRRDTPCGSTGRTV